MTIRESQKSTSSAPLEVYDTEVPIAQAVEIPEGQEYTSETTSRESTKVASPIAVSTGGPIFRASNPPVRQPKQVDRGCCNSHTCCCVTSVILTVFFLCCALPIIIFFIVAIVGASQLEEMLDDDIWLDDNFWSDDKFPTQDDLFNAINAAFDTDNAGNL